MLSLPMLYFVEVARLQSYTRAADQLYVSQSTISRQIAKLERELGYELLYRTTRHVSLTPSGQVLYDLLLDVQTRWERGLRVAELASATQNELSLRVGLLHGWMINRLPTNGFDSFLREYPVVDLTLEKYTYTELTTQLHDGNLDAIFTTASEIEGLDWIECVHVFDEPLVLFLSASHPLAKSKDIFRQFGGLRLYLMSEKASTFTMRSISENIRQRGLNVQIIPCPNFESIVMALDDNKGGSLTASASYVCEDPKYRSFDFGLSLNIVIAWRKDRLTPIINHFIHKFLEI